MVLLLAVSAFYIKVSLVGVFRIISNPQSKLLTALKAQHDPHCPWSLTGVI